MSTQNSELTTGKLSFNCPHCRAFAGHRWLKPIVTEIPNGLSPSRAERVLEAKGRDVPQQYVAYADEMLAAGLPFTRRLGAVFNTGVELLNLAISRCSACDKISLWVADSLVFPTPVTRSPAPQEVPPVLRADFDEAAVVLPFSAKASAALSRRCLQALLREQGFPQKDLANAIQALLESRQLPSGLAANVDLIRNVGNFAAHPMKDTNTGAILEVEPHEAEWNLEVLEGLFDFFYVGPAKDAQRRATYNAKLAQAGKPAMKS